MDRKKLLKIITILIFAIFFVNFLILKFYWYSLIWWLDMPMHFLGGLWVGLALLFIFPISKDILHPKKIFQIILGVLVIGIFWEFFEISLNNLTLKDSFNVLDTISDLFFDSAGASFAVFYYLKNIMFNSSNTV